MENHIHNLCVEEFKKYPNLMDAFELKKGYETNSTYHIHLVEKNIPTKNIGGILCKPKGYYPEYVERFRNIGNKIVYLHIYEIMWSESNGRVIDHHTFSTIKLTDNGNHGSIHV